MQRIEWTEVRKTESFYVIAERQGDRWEFWERSAWEVRWYPMTATAVLIARAERLANSNRNLAPPTRTNASALV